MCKYPLALTEYAKMHAMNLHEQMRRNNAWLGNRQPKIFAGADVERAAFGTIRNISEKDALAHTTYDEALDWVKNHQPTLEARPKIASDLRKMVAELSVDKKTPVKFFTAIGTALDIYYGIDAFIEQGSQIGTIDISMEVKERIKADVLLLARMDQEGRVTVSEEEMREVAALIADKFDRLARRAA